MTTWRLRWGVVRHPCRDEHVIVRFLTVLEAPVDEQALDVVVPAAARVAGVINAGLEVRPCRTVTGRDVLHLELGELRRLLEAYDLVLLALILEDVRLRVAVTQLQNAFVREREHALLYAVLRVPFQLRPQRHNVIAFQLRERTPQQQRPQARVPRTQQHELPAHGPALAATLCAAVRYVRCPCQEEKDLLLVRFSLQYKLFLRHVLLQMKQQTVQGGGA